MKSKIQGEGAGAPRRKLILRSAVPGSPTPHDCERGTWLSRSRWLNSARLTLVPWRSRLFCSAGSSARDNPRAGSSSVVEPGVRTSFNATHAQRCPDTSCEIEARWDLLKKWTIQSRRSLLRSSWGPASGMCQCAQPICRWDAPSARIAACRGRRDAASPKAPALSYRLATNIGRGPSLPTGVAGVDSSFSCIGPARCLCYISPVRWPRAAAHPGKCLCRSLRMRCSAFLQLDPLPSPRKQSSLRKTPHFGGPRPWPGPIFFGPPTSTGPSAFFCTPSRF